MSRLRPCPACARHVRASDARCPFCDGALGPAHASPTPRGRLHRAAQMAFGSALAASLAGCGTGGPGEVDGGTITDSAASDATPADTGTRDDAIAMPYGAPPSAGLLV